MTDRTVVTRLRLDVTQFVAGESKVKGSLGDLNRQFAQSAGAAEGFRKKLESAFKALPKIKLDADSSPAEVKVAELRAKLQTLAAQKIGVDLDPSAALLQMDQIQRELEEIERHTSFEVRADVGRALAELESVVREAQRLDDTTVQVDVEVGGGAFAEKLRAQVEAAARSLPKIRLDADSTPAQVKVAELRTRLDTLAGKRIGIDIDAAAALAEMAAVRAELEQLDGDSVTIDVRADAAAAAAALAAVSGEVSRLDGRSATVRVGADVAGALAGIATVAAALASLPAATVALAGAAGLGAAFGAAGAGALGFAAVAVPSLGRVNEALKQTESAAGGAGGATKSLAQAQAEAASRALGLAEAQNRVRDAAVAVAQAKRALKSSIDDVTRAQEDERRAAEDLARAVEDSARRHAEALRQVGDAERSVRDAQADALRAQQNLNDARQQAVRDAQDLASRLANTQIDQRQAVLDLSDAQARLNATLADPRATAAQKEQAQINYDRAQRRIEDLRLQVQRLQAEQAESDRVGVEGSKRVQDAKDALAQANERVLQAEQKLVDAQANVARVAQENARRVADAQRQLADSHRRVAEAQEKVISAQERLAKTQRDELVAAQRLKLERLQAKAALDKVGGAAGGAASKMNELSKRERELARDVKDFQDAYLEWQRQLQPDVFPVISEGLDIIEGQLPRISPLVRTAGRSFLDFEEDASEALEKPIFDTLLWNLNTAIPGAVSGLGASFLNVITGAAGVVNAFLPFAPTVVGGIEAASKRWAEWGTQLQNSPQFHEFIAFVKTNAPEVWRLIKDIATAGGDIVAALTPLGVGSLGGLGLLARIVSGMDPGHIQAIALAVAAIYTAVKVGGMVGKGVELVGTLGRNAESTGKHAAGARGKLVGFADSMSGLGLKAGIASGGLVILGAKFAAIENAAGRYAEKTAALGGDDLARQIAAVNAELAKQEKQIGFQLFGKLAFSQASADAANRADALREKLDDLTYQQELEAIHAKQAAGATSGLGEQAGIAAGGVGGLNDRVGDLQNSFNAFAGRTDALTALQNMRQAYKDASDAIEASNGKLEINARMTDAQRDAVIRAREQFATYLQRVKDGADAQASLSGKTTDSTKTILEQLPKMMELAGKNKEAREQVLKLAEAYGISRQDAIKAAGSVDALKKLLDKLKSKQIKIDADTKAAEDKLKRLYDWQLKIFGINKELPNGIAAPPKSKKKSDGGVSFDPFAEGGIRYFASGAENHVAQIAPAGAWRVWAEPETGGESYIPLAPSKRERSTAVLAETANIMGYQLLPAGKLGLIAMGNGGLVAGASTPVVSTGSATGGLTVSISNLGSMTAALDATSRTLAEQLAGASGRLLDTLGDGAPITRTIDAVGKTADKVAGATGKAATTTAAGTAKLTTAITGLTTAITKLTAAVSKAGGVAKSGTGGGGSGTTKPKPKAKDVRTDPNDVTYDRGPKPKAKADSTKRTSVGRPGKPQAKPKPTNQVEPYAGGGGGGDYIVGEAAYAGSMAGVTAAATSFGQAAGQAFGSVMAGSSQRSLPISGTGSGGTRPVKRSAPQMGGGGMSYGGPYGAGPAEQGPLAGRLAREAAGKGGRDAPLIGTYNAAPNDSPRKVVEAINFEQRRR
ncbi:hypothetical protein [Sphaerisporangium aureirubrum]|uniref:Tape measure protein n=1 Tax=Sphaerisporangium aureirubrum TaxID=1544736 RepID=A0ABW1NDQ1_9ACTN